MMTGTASTLPPALTAIERRLTTIWEDVVDRAAVAGTSDSFVVRDPRIARRLCEQIRIAFNVHISMKAVIEGEATRTFVARLIEHELNAGPLSN
jgi:hypothetical protein